MQYVYIRTLLALGAGILAGLSLVLSSASLSVILGVSLFFFVAKHSKSTGESLLLGLLFGLPASYGGVWWFLDTIPLSWLSVPPGILEHFLVWTVLSLTALSLALPFTLLALLVRLMPNRWYAPLLVALAYVATEELRLWSFALVFLAPESALLPDFSVGALGYALMEVAFFAPLAQAGTIGLNAFLGLLGAALSEATMGIGNSRTKTGALAAALCLTVSYLFLPSLPSGPTRTVVLLATEAPPGPFRDPSPVLALFSKAALAKPDIVAVPEGLGLVPFLPASARKELYTVAFGTSTLVISSSVVRDADGNERAELLYETGADGVIATQDKMFFVPVGEYLPPVIRAAISVVPKQNLNGYGSYIAGRAIRGTTFSSAAIDGMRVGALMCSELLSPRLYSALAHNEHTDVLINIANNSWFHGSRLLHARLKQVARMQALYNRQYLLVAANGSPAYAVDPRGRIIAESPWDTPTALIVPIGSR